MIVYDCTYIHEGLYDNRGNHVNTCNATLKKIHPLQDVDRGSETQLQVDEINFENYSDLTKCRLTVMKSYWLVSRLIIFNLFNRW